jgi:hypothetical protein
MAERGRPTIFTQSIADQICKRLAEGESLRRICRDEELPMESTVRAWALKDLHGFYAQYAQARDLGLDVMADQVQEIASGALDASDVPRARLEFDAKRWYLSKLAPKRYGDRIQNEVTGAGGSALNITVTGIPPTPENT